MGQPNVADLNDQFDDSFDDDEFDPIEMEVNDDEIDFLGLETDDELDDLFYDLQSGVTNKKDDLGEGPAHRSLPPDWEDFDYG